jgi:hypothetical protein
MDKRIGNVTIIITNRTAQAAQVNTILGEYGEAIIGRMGLPYPPKGLHIIPLRTPRLPLRGPGAAGPCQAGGEGLRTPRRDRQRVARTMTPSKDR